MLVDQNKDSDDRVQLNKAIEIVAELRMNNLTSVSHYSLGVCSNYSLFFLSSCWLFGFHSRNCSRNLTSV